MSRKFLALAGFALALAVPSTAFADDGKPWGGFKSGELSANIQTSVQAAHVEQQGASYGGNASANGGSYNDANAHAGTAATPTPVSRARCKAKTPTATSVSTGSVDLRARSTAATPPRSGNKGGSVSNDNATKVDVDAFERGRERGREGRQRRARRSSVNVNHEGDNKSIRWRRLSTATEASDGGSSGVPELRTRVAVATRRLSLRGNGGAGGSGHVDWARAVHGGGRRVPATGGAGFGRVRRGVVLHRGPAGRRRAPAGSAATWQPAATPATRPGAAAAVPAASRARAARAPNGGGVGCRRWSGVGRGRHGVARAAPPARPTPATAGTPARSVATAAVVETVGLNRVGQKATGGDADPVSDSTSQNAQASANGGKEHERGRLGDAGGEPDHDDQLRRRPRAAPAEPVAQRTARSTAPGTPSPAATRPTCTAATSSR